MIALHGHDSYTLANPELKAGRSALADELIVSYKCRLDKDFFERVRYPLGVLHFAGAQFPNACRDEAPSEEQSCKSADGESDFDAAVAAVVASLSSSCTASGDADVC